MSVSDENYNENASKMTTEGIIFTSAKCPTTWEYHTVALYYVEVEFYVSFKHTYCNYEERKRVIQVRVAETYHILKRVDQVNSNSVKVPIKYLNNVVAKR